MQFYFFNNIHDNAKKRSKQDYMGYQCRKFHHKFMHGIKNIKISKDMRKKTKKQKLQFKFSSTWWRRKKRILLLCNSWSRKRWYKRQWQQSEQVRLWVMWIGLRSVRQVCCPEFYRFWRVLQDFRKQRSDSMTDTVIVSSISLVGSLGGTLGGILVSNKLTNFRIEQF